MNMIEDWEKQYQENKKGVDELCVKINKFIVEYANIKNKEQEIGALIKIKEDMSVELAYARSELGRYSDLHKYCYARYKLIFTQSMKTLRDESEKFVRSHAEADANWASLQDNAMAVANEGLAERLKQTCLGAERIIAAIDERINWYKQEYKESQPTYVQQPQTNQQTRQGNRTSLTG